MIRSHNTMRLFLWVSLALTLSWAPLFAGAASGAEDTSKSASKDVPAATADNTGKDKADKKDSKDAEADVEQIGERNVAKGMNFYSLEEEIALGKQLAAQVEQQSRIIEDPVVGEYVNRVGQNLVRNSDAQVPFTIKVIDDPDEVNAFALPGGFFFVYSGLILSADNEAELAGVMAHEIAHVAARHVTRNASKAELANWLSLPLIFLGGPVGLGARSATSILVPMKFLQFSRSYEREADYLGLQYLYKSGYDPQSFIDFFEKIEEQEKSRPGTIAKAFATHPPTPDRIDASENEIKTILPPREEYVLNTGEFDRVHERLKVIENRGRIDSQKGEPGKPTLRRKTTASSTTVDSGADSGDDTGQAADSGSGQSGAGSGSDKTNDDDAPPTLKRRPE